MDCLAAVTSMSYVHCMPVKTHSDYPGTRLPTVSGRTAMQSVCDGSLLSANSGPDSLTLATDSLTAARPRQTQSADAHGSPPRSVRCMVCPGAPKKRLPTSSFGACTHTATSDSQWHHAAQAVPLRQDSHEDREALVMSRLISRATPVHSALGLLNRLNQMGANGVVAPGACTSTTTEAADSTFAVDFDDGVDNELTTGDGPVGEVAAARLPQQAGFGPKQGFTRGALAACSPVAEPQLKRIKSNTSFDAAVTTQAGSFQTAAGTSCFTQEALEGMQQDQAPVRADDPVDPVLKRAANQPSAGYLARHNSPGMLCVGNTAPEAVLAFTQGSIPGSSNATTQTWNRAYSAKRGSGIKPCPLPARVLQDNSAGQDAGLLGSIGSLTPGSQFFPSHKQQLFVTSFNLPMDPSPPPTLRPFFHLPWL